jgi:hypothetical protein
LEERSRGIAAPKGRFAMDSLLEGDGFELAVPRRIITLILVFAYVTPSI